MHRTGRKRKFSSAGARFLLYCPVAMEVAASNGTAAAAAAATVVLVKQEAEKKRYMYSNARWLFSPLKCSQT